MSVLLAVFLLFCHMFLQVKRFILRVQAALFSPEPCSDMDTTLQQLLEKFQSIGCYSQLFEQYL